MELVEIILTSALPARIEHLPALVEAVRSAAISSGLSRREILRMELAADEALLNAINYAYGGKEGEVEIVCRADHEVFSLEIMDRGNPFDPLSVKEPDVKADVEERRIGGLGIHLIRTLVDTVDYRREAGKNVLTLSLSKKVEG